MPASTLALLSPTEGHLVIPTQTPADLSPTALDLYRRAVREDRDSMKIETSDAAGMAAATEITEAGLGTLYITEAHGSTLRVARLAKGFSVARREDLRTDDAYMTSLLYVEVEVLRYAHDTSGVLLACLYGARFENKTNGRAPWPTWNTEVRHATATDSDHSSSIIATLDIDHPVIDTHDGYSTAFVGTLSSARMWPTGTDAAFLDSRTGAPIDLPEVCTYRDHCAKNPHPFGPYLPKNRDDLDQYEGKTVRVTTIPLSLVQPNGMHVNRTAITHADY